MAPCRVKCSAHLTYQPILINCNKRETLKITIHKKKKKKKQKSVNKKKKGPIPPFETAEFKSIDRLVRLDHRKIGRYRYDHCGILYV